MLHPAFAYHGFFIKQIEEFVNDFNLIILDLPGHGNSVHKGSNLNMGMVPNLINDILLHHNIKKVHVLGVSLGSLIAQGFEDLYPELVKTVTLVGGYSIHTDNKDVLKAQRKEMFKWLLYIIVSMKIFRKYIVKATVESTEGKEIVMKGIKPFRRRNFRYMQGLNHIFRETDVVKQYPLLSLVGEYDIEVSIESAIKLGNRVNGKYVMISNAGHCANIDNSKEFNSLFLSHILK